MLSIGVMIQRLVSSLTAAIVFLTSVHCVCGNAINAQGAVGCHERTESSSPPRHCHGNREQCPAERRESSPCQHERSGNHSPCNRCAPSMASEPSTSSDVLRLTERALTPELLACDLPVRIVINAFPSGFFFADLPPPDVPETLLRLHCALII